MNAAFETPVQGREKVNGLRCILRGAGLFGLSVAEFFLACWLFIVLMLCFIGIGVYLLPSAFGVIHRLANFERRLAFEWSGVRIPEPDRQEPEFPGGFAGALKRAYWLIGDATTWREVWWATFNSIIGGTVAFVPMGLLLNGIFGLIIPFIWELAVWEHSFYFFVQLTSELMAILAAVLGVIQLLIVVPLAPKMVLAHAKVTNRWLRPSENARLHSRVDHLTQTRSATVDTQAAELRRIERDLHDGAQARLVAMGMTITAAENLLDDNPEAARALLSEVKANSKKALTELRGLVRGIHPPVLADRGLADAIRTLAMEAALTVEVTSQLNGRPQPPVESAAYFATSELLNNVVKHAHAQQAKIEIKHEKGLLHIEVSDDGQGGANPAKGSGLTGIKNRLATFDGSMTISSPIGGPTVVSIEIPCELT